MANLENDEKIKILEQEIYRFEVQNKLASQPPRKLGELVWKVFNAPIMVVLLTAFIGGEAIIRFADKKITQQKDIDTLQENKETQQENNLVTERLKTEIAYRAILTKGHLDNLLRYEKFGRDHSIDEVAKLLGQAIGQGEYATSKLFKEYGGDTTSSLLARLKSIPEPGSSALEALDGAIATTAVLEKTLENIHSSRSVSSFEAVNQIARQLSYLAIVTGSSYLTKGANSD